MRILKLTTALVISMVVLTIATRQIGSAAPLPTRITRWHLHDPNCRPPTCFLGIRPEHSVEDIEKILAQRFPDFKLSRDGQTVSAAYLTGLEPEGSHATVNISCLFHGAINYHYCEIWFNHTKDETPTLGDVINLWGIPLETSQPNSGGWHLHYRKQYTVGVSIARIYTNPDDPSHLFSGPNEFALLPQSKVYNVYWKRIPVSYEYEHTHWIGFANLMHYRVILARSYRELVR